MPVRPLTPGLKEKAQVELFEEPKKLEDGIQHLKDWIAKQPHLRARTDDQWLAAYLRGCKFSLERCKEKIDLYYSIRSIAPEINGLNIKDPKFIELLKSGFALPLLKTADPTAPRVIFLRGGVCDPAKVTNFEAMSVSHVLEKIMFMEDDHYVVAGSQHVIDFKGVSFGHITQLTPVQVKQMVIAYRDALPTRMKATHYLNPPKAFETIFSIVKSLLPKKLNNRLVMHKDCETLYKYIPKEILPAEYGGNGGNIQEIADYWVKKVEEYSAWLEQDKQFGTDENLRPGKPKTAADMFGVEGSFRQLDFD